MIAGYVESGSFSASELLSLGQNQNGGSSDVVTVVVASMAIDEGPGCIHSVTGPGNLLHRIWGSYIPYRNQNYRRKQC